MRLLMMSVLTLFVAANAAGETCFKNMREFNAAKGKLPGPFQKMPIAMASPNAIFKLQPVDDGADAAFSSVFLGRIGSVKEQRIESICWKGNAMTVNYGHGKSEAGTYSASSKKFHSNFFDFEEVPVKDFNDYVYGKSKDSGASSQTGGTK